MSWSDADESVRSYTIDIDPSTISDLHERLRRTRWPDSETVDDWSQGARLTAVRDLVDYWSTRYDWYRCQAAMNAHGQFRTHIDGLDIHFVHVRSSSPDARPIILTHGWPGSVLEFSKVIGPLTDPGAHGGSARDAFHVVIPSLPGFAFSEHPAQPGWGLPRIALAWGTLMGRLGYQHYVAQGGDWGAGVATHMATQGTPGLDAIHLNLPVVLPPPLQPDVSSEEAGAIAHNKAHSKNGSGYLKIQSTRPQTLGYGLSDSPAGLAAWIYDAFVEWTDSSRRPEAVLTYDEMLDNIMLYWLPNSITSAARLYWESLPDFARVQVDLPVGCTVFPGEIVATPRVWAERTYPNLMYWSEAERGGHFAAWEQPEIFVRELRSWSGALRDL